MSAHSAAAVDLAKETFRSLGLVPGDVIDGKFRVEELIGVGGMSFVLRALHLQLEETVALKCLNPQWFETAGVGERFLREARAAVKIKSDHVARVSDFGKLPNGIPYMVMELLHGEDLGKYLDERQVLGVRETVGFLIEACEGLAEAHALGIVHRDVKPDNLFLVRRKGRSVVKLLDFGISKQLLTRGAAEPELDRTSELIGTPLYMSPEQVRTSRLLDHRTDIWSLGGVFYEMLTGRPPFGGSTITEVCASILEAEPEPPSRLRHDVSRELDQVVLRCLEKDPARRYPSIAEFALDLLPHAHPLYEAQVDRIVGTLHAAGLTELKPSVHPEDMSMRGSLVTLPDAPTLMDTSGVSQSGTGAQLVTSSVISTRTRAAATASERRSARRFLWPVLVLVALGAVAFAAAVLHRTAGSGETRRPDEGPHALPGPKEPVKTEPAVPRAVPLAVAPALETPAPSASAVPLEATAAPKKQSRTRPGASKLAPKAESSENKNAPAAQAPPNSRLDIELSR